MKPKLCSGKLITWKDDRGFGFVQPDDGSKDVFLHISELRDATRRPRQNDTIYYYSAIQPNGKTRAVNAFIAGARQRSPKAGAVWGSGPTQSLARFPLVELLLLSIVPFAGVAQVAWLMGNPLPLLLYPLMSIVTYALYADDKKRARQNAWRTTEGTLHICELLGGWPGGFVAQQVLRHKSQKKTYQAEFWAIVAAHHVGWLVWLSVGKALLG
ncbi:DUF1294 domain-containing protein [Leptolyngbya sp. KIOST-1]|uniref:DUF1294 domain-containing protein n=1 Tax=Leptolyngbya sp. KIOST-1 TaxID=1229172 RepID=UPI0005639CBA|nr:cold shock and DUF1294 domain-containing protein [Leptolyngbya sp. KIOST-1]